jgi:type IV secretory pathway VirB2 component (pilin)
MDSKKWYLSKTIWTGIVAVILAAYSTAAGQFGLPAIPEWVFGILGAFGVYTRATATTTLK